MLITDNYREQNALLHEGGRFGGSGHKHANEVRAFALRLGAKTVLDYGCGQATLAGALPDFSVRCYDPAVPCFSASPVREDLVVCTDVLEHVEPECLDDVLSHLAGLARLGLYLAIALVPDSKKLLPDGRNPHLIVQSARWWIRRIGQSMEIHNIKSSRKELQLWCLPC